MIIGNVDDYEYFSVHTTGFAGVAFQVRTTNATIYIIFIKSDVVSTVN